MKQTTLSSVAGQRQSSVSINTDPTISIIVPVCDEGERLLEFLNHLRERARSAEIVLVNAESSQALVESVIAMSDRVLTSRRGRAAQMNAGANVATGDFLWFVHADCEVPRGCLGEITRSLQDSRSVGGCFRIRFPRRQLIYRVSDAVGNLGVEIFGRCYGDHGIFCRRQDFFAVGGYPDLPLFEDAEFYRLLRQRGWTKQLASEIKPSPRRYEQIGPYRLTAAYLLLSMLYILRVPISIIAGFYQRLCVNRRQ